MQTVWAEFADASETEIIAIMGPIYDMTPFIGRYIEEIGIDDLRYVEWYDALPEAAKGGQVTPVRD